MRDVVVWNCHSSCPMVRPITEAARAWVDENCNVETWQWLGGGGMGSFAVDAHHLQNLINGMEEAGLKVQVR